MDDYDDFFSGTGAGAKRSYSDELMQSARSTQFLDSSSDDDDERQGDVLGDGAVSMESTSKRLDYMLQFLDRKLSMNSNDNSRGNYSAHFPGDAGSDLVNVNSILDSDSDHSEGHRRRNAPMPLFVGRGGGAGIFRLPLRAAVHPKRPPSLDVRPHPLRETQIGSFLRTIVAAGSQLWAGSECGLRVWDLNHLYAASTTKGEEEDTLPFSESVKTSPALCLVADEGTRVMWSGHRDGKIRCWRMQQAVDFGGSEFGCGTSFKEGLSWQAHRGPVLSLVISSYGNYAPHSPLMHFDTSMCFLLH